MSTTSYRVVIDSFKLEESSRIGYDNEAAAVKSLMEHQQAFPEEEYRIRKRKFSSGTYWFMVGHRRIKAIDIISSHDNKEEADEACSKRPGSRVIEITELEDLLESPESCSECEAEQKFEAEAGQGWVSRLTSYFGF